MTNLQQSVLYKYQYTLCLYKMVSINWFQLCPQILITCIWVFVFIYLPGCQQKG